MADYDISQAFKAVENELIDSMMKNFSRHRAEETAEGYNWSQWQAEQLKSLEQYRKSNIKKFNKRFSEINSKISEMLKTARADGNASQEVKILTAIKNGFNGPSKPSASSTAEFFKVNDRKLNALIKSTTDDLKSAETAVLRMSNDKYRKAIYNAQVYANSGAGTYEKAVDMACRDMLSTGLNCVEYSNGARHTLSDYAEMAIRTANKRAYLRGEGEKRAEWGISLVVVNQRQGGCPDCAQYIGQVFIDDVYSNGKKSDGDYPLLSEAIAGGLFHPRCKDSTSTYYEGITTLKKVSKSELSEMGERETLEQQKANAENQAEKCDRIAKYSLDEDNKRAYQSRAEQWQDKADEIGEKLDEFVANYKNDDIIKIRDVADLEQAKKRDHKIYINDIAIDKIKEAKISELSDSQNAKIDSFHRKLLKMAKDDNDSNEVAFLFDLQTDDSAYHLGTEHKVNVFLNPIAYSMANNAKGKSLFLAHNHPSTQDFSYSDLGVFLLNDSIGGISVVSNTGNVHILFKSESYSYNKAVDFISDIRSKYNDYSSDVDKAIVKEFLKVAKKAGILQY